jgi:hypothetical protein
MVRRAALLALALGCAHSPSRSFGTPIFSWEATPACAPEPAHVDTTHEELLEMEGERIRIAVPSRWMKAPGLFTEARRGSRGWADTAAGEWLAIGSLPLDSTGPFLGASSYLTDRFLDSRGDTIVAVCTGCLEIRMRCREIVGNRRALVTEAAMEPAVVTLLWPLEDGRWLALQAGGRDSTALPKLHARTRRIRFEGAGHDHGH